MEGIGNYDSDEDSNGKDKGEEEESLVRKWLDEEEEDSDAESDEETEKATTATIGSSSDKIASVDILFSSDTSKESNFLHTIAGKDEFKIPEYKQEARAAHKQQHKENDKVEERRSLSKAEELKLLDKQIEEPSR